MNVFEKFNYMQIELGIFFFLKRATLNYSIWNLCSVLSTSNHATVSSKDKNDFYKGILLNEKKWTYYTASITDAL